MNGFSSTKTILKQINEMGGSYIWKPINCSGNNHVLGCKLRELVTDGLLIEKDISFGWWIFKDTKLLYILTDKGLTMFD